MCNKKEYDTLEDRIEKCRLLLYDLQVFIKLGALASDSAIVDDDLQLSKDRDDYYIIFRTLNKKIKKAIDTIQTY